MKCAPINDWPERDRKSMIAPLQPGSILDNPGALSHLRAPSVRLLRYSYGCWFRYLLSQNLLDPDRSCIDLLSPDLLREYVAMLRNNFASITVANSVDQLGQLACVFQPESNWDFMQKVVKRLRRSAQPLKDINTRCPPSIKLYELGLKLIENAESRRNRGRQAKAFRGGLIISFLAARPLRLRNLAMISLDKHLRLRGGTYWFTLNLKRPSIVGLWISLGPNLSIPPLFGI
jgi:hypothetical protein